METLELNTSAQTNPKKTIPNTKNILAGIEIKRQKSAKECTPRFCGSAKNKYMKDHAMQYTNGLQHTAMHCNAMQHAATHCITLHRIAAHCNALQRTATQRNTLQCSAKLCNMRITVADYHSCRPTTTQCKTLKHTATH